jgi:hypothetical protein
MEDGGWRILPSPGRAELRRTREDGGSREEEEIRIRIKIKIRIKNWRVYAD